MVDDSALNQALDLRRSFILQNFESLTMKRLRDTLETDLKVESGSLKDYKKYISDYVDKLLANSLHCVGKEQGGKLDERKTVGSTRVSTNRVSGKFGDTVNKLRSVCRAATVAIPPCIYAQNKSEEELISALKTLLSKYGLRASSSAADISKVRAKLQLERDLDGIDVANILDRKGSRRSQQVNYR